MTILSIESFYQDEEKFYVTAMVEDVVQVYAQTYYEPAEYGPALCETTFTIDNEELRSLVIPDNDEELVKFLEELDLNWKMVDNSDDYFE